MQAFVLLLQQSKHDLQDLVPRDMIDPSYASKVRMNIEVNKNRAL